MRRKLKKKPYQSVIIISSIIGIIGIICHYVYNYNDPIRPPITSTLPPWSNHPHPYLRTNLSCIQSTAISIQRYTTNEYNNLISTGNKVCSPMIITDALASWNALHSWNKDFFSTHFGQERATAKGQLDSDSPDSFALPLRMFAKHSHEGHPDAWTYLQDELFIPSHPSLLKDLQPTPSALQHDWFSYLPKSIRPHHAFLLWGTAFSRSTLHIDPYNWTGTNALLYGSKSWKFIPPNQDHNVYPIVGATCGSPLDCFKYQSKVDAFNIDLVKYPNFSKVKVIDAHQIAGELVIIPPGWYHQVLNPEESIAVASQIWNDDSFDISLEEIMKYPSNVDINQMPNEIERRAMSNSEKFQALIKAIPTRVFEEAEDRLEDALKKIQGRTRKGTGGLNSNSKKATSKRRSGNDDTRSRQEGETKRKKQGKRNKKKRRKQKRRKFFD